MEWTLCGNIVSNKTFTFWNTWNFAESCFNMKIISKTNTAKWLGSKGWSAYTAQQSTHSYNLASRAKLHKENAGPEF